MINKNRNPKGNIDSIRKATEASIKSPKRYKFNSETSRIANTMRDLGRENARKRKP